MSVPPSKPGMTGIMLVPLTAFGKTKSVTEWARDRRCVVTLGGLRARLQRQVPAEKAITSPPWKFQGSK